MNRLLPAGLVAALIHAGLFFLEWDPSARALPPKPARPVRMHLETVARPRPMEVPPLPKAPPSPPREMPPPPPQPVRKAEPVPKTPTPKPLSKARAKKSEPPPAPRPPEPAAPSVAPAPEIPPPPVPAAAPPSAPPPVPAIVEATPMYQSNPPPEYPLMARRQGQAGTVTLKVRVNAQGGVDDAAIWKSCGYDILDRSALKAVRGWRFVPGTENGRPAPMWVRVPVSFILK